MKTLALSTKVSNGVKPPAKKHEVIAAMAIVKQKQLIAERDQATKDKEELGLKIEKDLISYADANHDKLTPDVHLGYDRSNGSVDCIAVKFDLPFENLPKALQKDLRRYHDIPCHCGIPTLTDIQKQIRSQMEGHTAPNLRVQALVETPETLKTIEKLLTALDTAAVKKPATVEV